MPVDGRHESDASASKSNYYAISKRFTGMGENRLSHPLISSHNVYYVKYSLAMLDLVPASAPPRQALAELQDAAHCATFAVRVLDELREQANSRRLQKREYGGTAPVKTAT